MRSLRFLKMKLLRGNPRGGWKMLRAESAQALVELALSVSLLSLITVGVAQIGSVLYDSIAVTDAAMAGVQYGTRNPSSAADTTGIENAAQADAPGLTLTWPTPPSLSCICSDGSASTCLSTDCPTSNIETILNVQTQTSVTPLAHLPGLPTTITLHGQAIQKVLQ